MAFILLKNHQPKFVSAKQGATIWRVMNGEIKGTKKQQAFVKRIERVYLNRESAPASYIDQYPDPTVRARRHRLEPAGPIRLPYID